MWVGLVGLGTMGARFASRLLANGFDVVAYDARREAVDQCTRHGGKPAASARDVADRA